MKKSALHFAAYLFLTCSLIACKKENYTDQLSNNWKSTQVQWSNLALADNFMVNLNLGADNHFTTLYKIIKPIDDTLIVNQSGIWREHPDQKQFTLYYQDGSEETYRIIALTPGQMRAETVLEDKILTVTFVSSSH